MISPDIRVVAVVVTYNRPKELLLVVNALQEQSRAPDNILIIDNASAIPASTTLSEYSGIDVIRSEVNTGGSGGFAAGVEAAMVLSADWIWLLDDDAVPRIDALRLLLSGSVLLQNRVGALCSAVYEYGELAPMHRRSFTKLIAWERAISKKKYREEPVQIDTGSFVGFLLNAHVVRLVGLPNTNFFMAYDDTEYSLRLINAGYTNWLIPASKIDHLRQSGTRLRYSPFGHKHYYNVRNRLAVAVQHSKWKMAAACLAIISGFAIWLGCGGLKHPGTVRLLFQAFKDGLENRLGKLRS